MIHTIFHIQVHTALASGHVQVGKQSIQKKKTPSFSSYKQQAIEKQKQNTN